MEIRIQSTDKKKLIGISRMMSVSKNSTGELWRDFMVKVKGSGMTLGTMRYSLQVYPLGYFEHFDPEQTFKKWALVEMGEEKEVPSGFSTFYLPSGLYVVFSYKGSSTDNSIFQYIFSEWIPNSEYKIDDRPHFEQLGEKYKNDDEESEEEIWIPITRK